MTCHPSRLQDSKLVSLNPHYEDGAHDEDDNDNHHSRLKLLKNPGATPDIKTNDLSLLLLGISREFKV